MMRAITRAPGPALSRCELTFVERQPIDVALATAQHAGYTHALERAGVEVETIPADDRLPDSVFIEDTAVVLDELAIIARPGAPSRRMEVDAVAPAVSRYRRLAHIQEPATLDGGDVLRIGHDCFVARSTRTNDDGVRQLSAIVREFGYQVTVVEIAGCLHLKSAVASLRPGTVLLNSAWVDRAAFRRYQCLEVPAEERFAADCLVVENMVHVSSSWPRTRDLLERHGFGTRTIDISEFEKAEGGLTCLSLLFSDLAPRRTT